MKVMNFSFITHYEDKRLKDSNADFSAHTRTFYKLVNQQFSIVLQRAKGVVLVICEIWYSQHLIIRTIRWT